jgi:hypothetical protein
MGNPRHWWGSDGSSANAVKRWPTGGLVFRKQRRKALTRKSDHHRKSSSVREMHSNLLGGVRFAKAVALRIRTVLG